MPPVPAYIIAARRTAVGRIGGLHKTRRIEELCAPLIGAALQDSGLEPEQIDEVIVGNASQGGNPARLIALAAGLPDTVSATTIDRQCGSGLDAILSAIRRVALGDAEAIIAGGAETVSTAPWRISKPKSLLPASPLHELRAGSRARSKSATPLIESTEALSAQLGISRAQQDAYALAHAPQGGGRALEPALRRRDRAAARQRRGGARPERGRARLQGPGAARALSWRPTAR